MAKPALKQATAATNRPSVCRPISEGPVYDDYRSAKNPNGHGGHDVKLSYDPNAKNAQWLAPSCPSEKEHSDGDRNQNNSACEIHFVTAVH
jgi:hypothetical protein